MNKILKLVGYPDFKKFTKQQVVKSKNKGFKGSYSGVHPYFSELVLSEVRLPQQLRSPRAWGEYNLKHMKQLMRIRFFAACIASLGTSCWRIPRQSQLRAAHMWQAC